MGYQFKAGPYDSIDVSEYAEGEGFVVTEGDPTTESGHSTYVCMEGGIAQRMLTAEDIMDGWAQYYLKPNMYDAETGQPTIANPDETTIYHTLVDGIWKKWTYSGDTWTEIENGEISGADLADNSISTAKLVDGAVTNTKLADSSVSGSKIQANAISKEKLDQSLRDSISQVKVLSFDAVEIIEEQDNICLYFRNKSTGGFYAFTIGETSPSLALWHKPNATSSNSRVWSK